VRSSLSTASPNRGSDAGLTSVRFRERLDDVTDVVFMPLDDPLFTERTVADNSEDVIYVTPLAEQFDAVMQYGVAHRMPVD
jgi:hypothetical protein